MPNPRRMLPLVFLVSLTAALAPLAGCSSAGIWARESRLGQEKREQLVNSVVAASDQQEDAKDTFSSALDELLAISSGSASTRELEAQYRALESSFGRSEEKADAVRSRIRRVERVADALFGEWETELTQYESENLRRQSERTLNETRSLYSQLIGAMNEASSRMDPVLAAFRDQTLFLKHNLNARAIASLQTDLDEIQIDVRSLIAEMEAAIAEADKFVRTVRGS